MLGSFVQPWGWVGLHAIPRDTRPLRGRACDCVRWMHDRRTRSSHRHAYSSGPNYQQGLWLERSHTLPVRKLNGRTRKQATALSINCSMNGKRPAFTREGRQLKWTVERREHAAHPTAPHATVCAVAHLGSSLRWSDGGRAPTRDAPTPDKAPCTPTPPASVRYRLN